MVCNGYTKVWELSAGEMIRLDGARGTTLRVTRGTLWVTLEGHQNDIVLAAGDSFMIDRGGLTLVEAQSSATVCVLARYVDEVRVRAGRPGFAAQIVAWFASVRAAGIGRGSVPNGR